MGKYFEQKVNFLAQMRSIHTDCKKIVKEYSDGEMPFYEYKAKMKKCTERM